MATLVSGATGNFTAAGTWRTVATASNSFLTTASGNSPATVTTSGPTARSSAFTPGALTIDAIGVRLAALQANPTGTVTVQLYNSTAAALVAGATCTIDAADLPQGIITSGASFPWLFFKFAAPVTLIAGNNYMVEILRPTGTGQLSMWRDATANNWSRILRTTTTAAPAAGDDLIVAGDYTGSGTGNNITVTMNSTAATDYGSGASAAAQATQGGLEINPRGTLTYGTAAATSYILRLSGSLIVEHTGTLNIGTVATPIPRDSTAVLEFDPLSADGDYGLIGRNGSTVNIQGLSRTSGKDIVVARLKRSVSHNRMLQSQTFGTTWAAVGGTVTSDTQTAPDATVTADTFTATGVGGNLRVAGAGAGPRHTYSVYIKQGTATHAHLTTGGSGNSAWATFDLSGAGAVTQSGQTGNGTLLASGITSVGSGWYRCWIAYYQPGVTTGMQPVSSGTPAIDSSGIATTVSGDSIHVWGAQVEQEQNLTGPGPYLPTTTAMAYGGEWKVDTDTGWLSGDMVAIASTSLTPADCQAALLSANATADTLTVNHVTAAVAAQAFPLTSGVKGIASAIQEGIATQGTGLGYMPQAEIILVTRNVKIRSTSATLIAYVYFGNTAVVDIDWAEFYYLGFNAATKRGIEVDVTTGSFSMMYSCVHDTEAGGVHVSPAAANNILVQHCVFWNCDTAIAMSGVVMVSVATTGHNIVFDNLTIIRTLAGGGIATGDGSISLTNITVAGTAALGIAMSEVGTNNYSTGTFSNLVVHSSAGSSFNCSTASKAVITDLTTYRSTAAIELGGASDITIDGFSCFGHSQNGIRWQSAGVATLKNGFINGDLAFAQPNCVSVLNTGFAATARFLNCEFSTVSGIKVAASGRDLSVGAQSADIVFENCLFGAATEVFGQNALYADSIISSQRHDQTAGNHKFWARSGTGQSDATIYRTASPSLRMTPNASALTFTATTASGSPTLSAISSFANLVVGQHVTGTGIPDLTTIAALSISADTITLSANASASAAGVTITIYDKLPSAPPSRGIQAAVASGGTLTPSVYVRKNMSNWATYSEQFDNAAWAKAGLTATANSATAPDSTMTADEILEVATNSRHELYINGIALAAGDWCLSFYVQAVNGRNECWLGLNLASVHLGVYFTLSGAGTVGAADAGYTGAITSVGSGWYRCSIHLNIASAATYYPVLKTALGGAQVFMGDITKGLYVWGAMLHKGTTLNAYDAEVRTLAARTEGYEDIEPRLIVRANPSAGIAADTVLDTATPGNNGTWELLTGTTAAVTDDAVLEFYVDCEGAAGWINVDDWSVA